MKETDRIVCVVAGVLIIAAMLVPVVGADESDIVISINPVSQTVDSGDTFNVNINCAPGRPIKAFEFKLSFNPSLLQANSVVEGDIFSGYTTFFNDGTIDNNAGTIVDVYDLIVGGFNVSAAGTLVIISFTAKSVSGVSLLDLYSVGVCDENGYLSTVVTDGSVTVVGTSSPPPPSPPELPPSSPGGDETNSPPLAPLEVSGPTFVEMGVEYGYTLSTVDPEGDGIRYKIDWGDGVVSDWSGLVSSGMSVLFSHAWDAVGTFPLMVIAEDEHGFGTGWDFVFDVIVSGVNDSGSPPVGNFSVSGSLVMNGSLLFDASGSFDLDGVVVSYFWDFGDGTNGSGVVVEHVYSQPGTYVITLIVTDSSGNTFTKRITRTIVADSSGIFEGQDQNVLEFNFLFVIVGVVVAVLVCLLVVFRTRIHLFVLEHRISSLSQNVKNKNKQIKKVKSKSK